MAKKATITPVTDTVNNANAINTQLTAINNKLENTLSLDGSGPNAMNADLDLNSNDILNAGNIYAGDIVVAGNSVAASASASAASASASAASASEAAASVAGINGLLDDVTATAIELNYTDGVTSNIQTQLDGKQPLSAVLTNTTASFLIADETKLDGIEALADVTDTTNVTAAGALMDSEVTNLAQVKAFSSADYATAAQGTTADAALPKAGGAMTGPITTNSTFDGRDVSVDGAKLDGIEALADVTDVTNVTAAGALMDSELASITSVKALNQGVATTDSPTFAGLTLDGNSFTNNVIYGTNPTLMFSDTGTDDDWRIRNSGGAFIFENGVDGAPTTDRMRIDLDGDVMFYDDASNIKLFWDASAASLGIGTSSPNSALDVISAATCMELDRTGSDGYAVAFQRSGTTVGNISVTASATAYNTSSDYRLKEDWQPMLGASDRVMTLNPVNFAWKLDGSRVDGFLAHEVQSVVPEVVTGEKDAVDADGVPEMQAIDQSKLVPLLTAALQEALTKIDALEVRVTALETV